MPNNVLTTKKNRFWAKKCVMQGSVFKNSRDYWVNDKHIWKDRCIEIFQVRGNIRSQFLLVIFKKIVTIGKAGRFKWERQ